MNIPKTFFIILTLTASLCLSSCAPSRFIRPLQKDQKAVAVNVGGPLIGFAGTTIPIPLSSLAFGYGWKEKTTSFAALHLTALAFKTVQTEFGLVHQIRQPQGLIPGVSINPVLNLAMTTAVKDIKLWPQTDINFYWQKDSTANLVYIGFGSWFEFAKLRSHGEKQEDHWIPSCYVGYTFNRPKFDYSIEVKYIEPFASNKNLVVDYKGIGGFGTIGVYFNISFKY